MEKRQQRIDYLLLPSRRSMMLLKVLKWEMESLYRVGTLKEAR